MKNNQITSNHILKTNGVVTTLLLGGILASQAQYNFAHIDVPGAWGGQTSVSGISGNRIVGSYHTSYDHGFLYDGSSYTKLDVPGAIQTHPVGISGNSIVGNYLDSNGSSHSFYYDGSSYTTLSLPWTSSSVSGISGNAIIGNYIDGGNHAFLYSGGGYTTVDVPGAFTTYPNGISGSNIVGFYDVLWIVGVEYHGFLYDGSSFTTLDVPGAFDTDAAAISGNNIVGWYDTRLSGISHGFLYNGTSYTTIDAPGATSTLLTGIFGNNIVGNASGFGAFLATPAAVSHPVLINPTLSGSNFTFSFATAQNQTYTVQQKANLATPNWSTLTNFSGNGSIYPFTVPATNVTGSFYRVYSQ